MQAKQMVATQDQCVPPPEPTVPEPSGGQPHMVEDGELAETISDVKCLAQRLGGLERLKRIVDMLASIKE